MRGDRTPELMGDGMALLSRARCVLLLMAGCLPVCVFAQERNVEWAQRQRMRSAALDVWSPSVVAPADEADSLVLVQFFHATGGPGWINNMGWLAGPVTGWFGVDLNSAGRVTKIVLRENGLTGSIPEEVGALAAATTLILPDNRLQGAIPAAVGQLLQRTELSLVIARKRPIGSNLRADCVWAVGL